MTRSGEGSGDFAGQLGRDGFAAGGFLEEEDGGQGLAGDVVIAEDGDHLEEVGISFHTRF